MATSKSKTSVNYFSQYKANKTWEVNRKRKLAKVLKDQPNNQQVKDAMSGMVYRRKTPTTRQWSASAKRIAQMYKKVTGVCSIKTFLAMTLSCSLPQQRFNKLIAK